MNRKGDLLFWGINELLTTKEEIEKLGFSDFVPRNDFKTAMIKTLREITKGNDKLYRRFNDTAQKVSFGLFVQTATENNISIDKEVVITVDKIHGNLDFHTEVMWDATKVKEIFKKHCNTINSQQLRDIVMAIIHKSYGVAMRRGGGIYFVDGRFEDKKADLAKIFDHFREYATLHCVPVYDDIGTLNALEEATSLDIFGDIDALVGKIEKGFKEGTITRRQLEGDKTRCQAIVAKIKVHEINLRAKASQLSGRIAEVMKAVDTVTAKVEDGLVSAENFMDLLKGSK